MIDKMQKTVLRVNFISKGFSNVKAVNNISFAVEQGDIYAFLEIGRASWRETV